VTKAVIFDQSTLPLPSVWSEAQMEGTKYYDSGVPCRNDPSHRSLRYTNNRKCVDCTRQRAKTPESIHRVKAAYAAMTHQEKMVSWAKYRHKNKGYPGTFDLTIDALAWPDHCPALGIRLRYEAQQNRNADDAPTIDRKNPSLGYTRDNVQVISRKANRIKNDGTPEEIMRIALFVAEGEAA
jgi:hypothetical protein